MSTQVSELPSIRQTAPPGPEEISAAKGDPIDGANQRAVESLLRELGSRYAFLPHRIADDDDVEQHAVLKECFRGDCFQYALCGLSDEQRHQAVGPLQQAMARERLPLTAVDSGSLILIHQASSNKGRALDQFADAVGLPASEIFKFGDSAGPAGNDREMLRDARSFNVGAEPAASPEVVNLGDCGPDGVVEILDWLDAGGTFPKAIAADFDKTLNRGETSAEHELDPRIAERFVQYAQAGVKIGIITGRGESFFADGLPPLHRAGLDERSSRNLSVYLFNGARPVDPDEWLVPEELTRAA